MIRWKVLEQDASSKEGNWIHIPHIILLGLFYIRALVRLYLEPQYQITTININSSLYENHLGNYAILKKAPATWMIVSHMLMAIFWVFSTLTQKLLIRGMAKGSLFYTRVHIILGTSMCIIGIFGCTIGGLIAYRDHGHSPMRWFLMLLPCSFLPSILATWISARKRNIANHRFWATTAFIGPCLSSLWAEEFIYRFGRQTFLGPWSGELWGTGIAAILHLLGIVLPAWIVRCRQLSSYQETKETKTQNEVDTLSFTDGAAPVPQRVKSE